MTYRELKKLLTSFELEHAYLSLNDLDVVLDIDFFYKNLVGIYINKDNQIEFSSNTKGDWYKS